LIAVHLPSGEKKDTLDTKYASSASNYKLFYTWKHLPSGEKKDTLDTKYASSASNYKLFYTWKSCAVHKCFKECCYCF